MVWGAGGEGRGGAVRGAHRAAATRITVTEVEGSSLCFSGDEDLGKRLATSYNDKRLICFHCTEMYERKSEIGKRLQGAQADTNPTLAPAVIPQLYKLH